MDFRKVETGQTINFSKDFEDKIEGVITFNLNWENRGTPIDLDAFLIMDSEIIPPQVGVPEPTFIQRLFGKKRKTHPQRRQLPRPANVIYFGNLRAKGVKHYGDDRTGAEEEGEFIEVDLNNLAPKIKVLTFAILSYSGHKLKDVPSTSINIFTGSPDAPKKGLLTHSLNQFSRNAYTVVMAQLVKNLKNEWEFKALNHESPNGSVDGLITFTRNLP